MEIIGCDFLPSYQQVVLWDEATGEVVEKALSHERKEEVRGGWPGGRRPSYFLCFPKHSWSIPAQ